MRNLAKTKAAEAVTFINTLSVKQSARVSALALPTITLEAAVRYSYPSWKCEVGLALPIHTQKAAEAATPAQANPSKGKSKRFSASWNGVGAIDLQTILGFAF